MAKTKLSKKIITEVNKYLYLLKDDGIEIKNAFVFGSYASDTAKEHSDIDVCIVSLHYMGIIIWKIKRVSYGNPFMGWALEDGTFTPGLNPTPEAIGSMIFKTKEYAVEFAEEQGWNVVSIIER